MGVGAPLTLVLPTRAVAKAISSSIIKTKMQLAVFSAEPTENTETLRPWGWGVMALAAPSAHQRKARVGHESARRRARPGSAPAS